MAKIQHLLDKIRTAIYGKEVRGSLADGLEAINKETEDATEVAVNVEQRQDAVEQQFDDVLAGYSEDRPISNEETIAARTNRNTNENYGTIGQRLDAENKKVNAQLAEKANQSYVNAELNNKASKKELEDGLRPKADQSFVDAQFTSIVSGAPKGTFANLQALKDAYPNGSEGVFLVLEDGHWYYWNESVKDWLDGGLYQAVSWEAYMTIQDEEWMV